MAWVLGLDSTVSSSNDCYSCLDMRNVFNPWIRYHRTMEKDPVQNVNDEKDFQNAIQ